MRRSTGMAAWALALVVTTVMPASAQPYTGFSSFEWGAEVVVDKDATARLPAALRTTQENGMEVRSAEASARPAGDMVLVRVRVRAKLPPLPDPPPLGDVRVGFDADHDATLIGVRFEAMPTRTTHAVIVIEAIVDPMSDRDSRIVAQVSVALS